MWLSLILYVDICRLNALLEILVSISAYMFCSFGMQPKIHVQPSEVGQGSISMDWLNYYMYLDI